MLNALSLSLISPTSFPGSLMLIPALLLSRSGRVERWVTLGTRLWFSSFQRFLSQTLFVNQCNRERHVALPPIFSCCRFCIYCMFQSVTNLVLVLTHEGPNPCNYSPEEFTRWNSLHEAFWGTSRRDLSQKFKLVWIRGTIRRDQCWSKLASSHYGTCPRDLLQGLVAGTSPLVYANLNSFKSAYRPKCFKLFRTNVRRLLEESGDSIRFFCVYQSSLHFLGLNEELPTHAGFFLHFY